MKIIILTIIALLINGCGGGAVRGDSDTTPTTTKVTPSNDTQPTTYKPTDDTTLPPSTVTPTTSTPTTSTKESYNLSQINGSSSALKYSGAGITIGVVDSGFDVTNSEFDGIDIVNRDFTNYTTTTTLQIKHGNQILQTIGANQSGLVKGITNNASFVLGNNKVASSAYSTMNMFGATVINNSWEVTNGYGNFIDDVTNRKIQTLSSKIVFIFGMGNDNKNINDNPYGQKYITMSNGVYSGTIDDNIILVGSLNQDGTTKKSYSNYGSSADVFVQDKSFVDLDGTVSTSEGTSTATAIVTSVVAMAQEANPSIAPAKLMNLICSTATHIGTDPYDIVDINGNMRSKTFGCGKLNVDSFIRAVESEI